jgi:alkanesulfonate monooxygenase SsuD/methylene tetrahydromethanopterin reductase-like flavin-dependent oxidoreductase (luciferase family)
MDRAEKAMTDRLPLTFATPASSRSWEQAVATAQAAEAAGFWGIGLGERFDGSLTGWTLATALAARTQTLRFFHTTLNVPYRYPYILAQEAAALDVISEGRVILCLGTGFEPSRQNYLNAGLPFGTPGERLQDMRDVIAILRGVWSGERFSHKGRFYSVEDVAPSVRPVNGMVPIWIGAGGPRLLRLTGQIADGFMKNLGWGPVEDVRALNDAVSDAAVAAGRDPNAIRRVMNGAAFVAHSEAELQHYNANAPRPVGGPQGGLIGSPEQIMATLRQYRAAGVDTFNVTFPPETAPEQIQRFGRQIIDAARDL